MKFGNPFTHAAQSVLNMVSQYADPFEEKVDHLLGELTPNSDKAVVRERVLALMQEDAVKFHFWVALRYQKEPELSKEQRLQLYANLQAIREAFEAYCFMQVPEVDSIYFEIFEKGVNTEQVKSRYRELQCLKQIMDFFLTQVPVVRRESSSFTQLLRDPASETLAGSCFEMISLYLYLFAIRYDITSLNIKAIPNHICLHLNGVDIETTQGSFENYKETIMEIVPIAETVVMNLLNIPEDPNTTLIPPKKLLEAATLSYLLSDREEVLTNNLQVAFRKLILRSLEKEQFDNALEYALYSTDEEAIFHVGLKGASYFLKQQQFEKARKFGIHAKDKLKVLNTISHNEGVYYLNGRNFAKALEIFKELKNEDYMRRCYAGLFLELQRGIRAIKYLSELKKQRKTLLKMKYYAEKANDDRMKQYTALLLKRIGG